MRFCHFVVAVTLLSSIAALGQGSDADRRNGPSVLVQLGKPHVWTLEEAHYLLERNRLRDLGLQEQDPSPLDPNQTVAVRANAIRTLLSNSVQFDSSLGLQNRTAQDQYRKDISQYNALRGELPALENRQAQVTTRLAEAQAELTALNNASPQNQTAINTQQQLVNQLTADSQSVAAQINTITTLTATKPSLSVSSSIPGDETSQSALGDDPAYDAMLKGFAPGYGNSRISASNQLDNYINMQYEMVAKQLTLLRDQAGPGNRVLIVELPHSIYSTSKLHLWPDVGTWWGSYIAQSWWRIDSTLSCQPINPDPRVDIEPFRCPDFEELQELASHFDEYAGAVDLVAKGCAGSMPCGSKNSTDLAHDLQSSSGASRQALRNFFPAKAADWDFKTNNISTNLRGMSLARPQITMLVPAKDSVPDRAQSTGIAEQSNSEYMKLVWWANWWRFSENVQASPGKGVPTGNTMTQTAYALDLIPRQSSLNVAQVHSSTGQTGFAGLFGFLSGLGAKARFERQHQEFDQYTQQETYASAFGKGDSVFGWTFGTQPGTRQLNEGLRTTYAVLVVPANTTALRLEATGCGYRRRVVPDNPFSERNYLRVSDDHKLGSEDCGAMQIFYLEVPPTDDDIWVERVQYKKVAAGQRQIVTIDGQFGREVGVLVNGTPLQDVPAIAQPMLTAGTYTVPANAGDSAVQGVYENIEGKHLVLSFVAAPAFTGIPTITLVSVGREKTINGLPVWPKEADLAWRTELTTSEEAEAMFYQPPAIDRLASSGSGDTITVTIIGQGFKDPNLDKGTTLLIAGHEVAPDTKATGAVDEYQWKNSGVLIAKLTRSTYFPHWSTNYIVSQGEQALTANYTQDDDLEPTVSECRYTVDDDGSLHFAISGNYFEASNTVSISAKGSALNATNTYAGAKEWDLVLPKPDSIPAAIQGTVKSSNWSINVACSKTPSRHVEKKKK